MNFRLFFLASALSVAAARRVAVRKTHAPKLVDITGVVEEETFKQSGYRCCCDKRKSWKDDMRGAQHVGYCKLNYGDKCGHVKVAPTTSVAHDFEDTDGKCEVPETEVSGGVVEVSGSAPDYCRETSFTTAAGEVTVPAGELLKVVAFSCPAGWQPEGPVECKFDSFIAGQYTKPECKPLFDVTALVNSESFKTTGNRCCCDKRKGLKDDLRGKTHAGWCKVASSQKCGDVKVVASTVKAHDYKDTDGRCEIPVAEVKEFYETHGSPNDYCSAETQGQVSLPASGLGQNIDYSCSGGYKPSAGNGTAECVYDTPEQGRFTKTSCVKARVHCEGLAPSDGAEGQPKVSAAKVGESVMVICPLGFAAKNVRVKCSPGAHYEPLPECVEA